MNLTYTPITTDHVDELMVIENSCHTHPWSKNTFTSCIGGRYFGYSLHCKQQLIGFYIGDYVAGEATLMDICVSPNHQGHGYGRDLLDHFFNQAKEQQAKVAFLEVRAKNISALMMYINQGFTEIDRRTGYYPSEIGYEDAIVMKKKL